MIHIRSLTPFLAVAFVGLGLGGSSPCRGDFVRFEGFGPSAFFGDNNPGNGLEAAISDGFAFTSGSDHFHIGDHIQGQLTNGTGILLEDLNTAITMTPVGGGAFNLLSADIAQDNSSHDPGTGVIVTGFFSKGGSIRTTISLPPIPNQGFQHATFVGYSDLMSMTFRGTGNPSVTTNANGFTLDNAGFSNNAVPEPSSGLALGTGVLVLLGCGWRGKSGALKRRTA